MSLSPVSAAVSTPGRDVVPHVPISIPPLRSDPHHIAVGFADASEVPGCPTRTPKPRGEVRDPAEWFPTKRGAPAPGSQGTAHPPRANGRASVP